MLPTPRRHEPQGYSYSKEMRMQSTERAFSSSSSRWLCRDTCRCRMPTSVTYFILGRKHHWLGRAPSSPHMQPATASPSPSGLPLPGSGASHHSGYSSPPLYRNHHGKGVAGIGSRGAEQTELEEVSSGLPTPTPLGISCTVCCYLSEASWEWALQKATALPTSHNQVDTSP